MTLTELAASLLAAAARVDAITNGNVEPGTSGVDAYREAWGEIEDTVAVLQETMALA